MQNLVEGETHHLADDVEHRNGNYGPPPGPLAVIKGREHRGEGVQRGADVGDRDAGLGGLAGTSGDRARPTLGLHEQVVGTLVIERAPGAVPGDVDHDQSRMLLDESGRREPEPPESTRCQIADHNVGQFQESGKQRPVLRDAQVERDGFLAVVEPHEVRRQPAHRPVVMPCGVTTGRVLDLDHARSEVGEMPCAQRRGHRLLQGEDRDPVQRRVRGFHVNLGGRFCRCAATPSTTSGPPKP